VTVTIGGRVRDDHVRLRGTGPVRAAKTRSRQALEDIRSGRHTEAYALFLIGVAMAVLGLTGVVSDTVMLSAMLLALSYLVFHTTVHGGDRSPALDQVLGGRPDLGSFRQRLPGVRDLRIYGPTAANLLMHAADIRRFVLRTGGQVRVIVLSDSHPADTLAAIQLDDILDLAHNLRNSLAILRKLGSEPGFSCRQLPVNPGFGLVIVNASDPDGYVIFESHGFQDDNIADRMHIIIRRDESPRWFAYWVDRYEAMWRTARPLPSGPADPASEIPVSPPSAGEAEGTGSPGRGPRTEDDAGAEPEQASVGQ
jgi:hypothetical protein